MSIFVVAGAAVAGVAGLGACSGDSTNASTGSGPSSGNPAPSETGSPTSSGSDPLVDAQTDPDAGCEAGTCSPVVLATAVKTFAIAGDNVVWITADYRLMASPADGSGPPRSLAEGSPLTGDLWASGANAFVRSYTSLLMVPVDGSPPVTIASGPGEIGDRTVLGATDGKLYYAAPESQPVTNPNAMDAIWIFDPANGAGSEMLTSFVAPPAPYEPSYWLAGNAIFWVDGRTINPKSYAITTSGGQLTGYAAGHPMETDITNTHIWESSFLSASGDVTLVQSTDYEDPGAPTGSVWQLLNFPAPGGTFAQAGSALYTIRAAASPPTGESGDVLIRVIAPSTEVALWPVLAINSTGGAVGTTPKRVVFTCPAPAGDAASEPTAALCSLPL